MRLAKTGLAKTYFALAILAGIIGGAAVDTAQADPYKWCALYSGGRGGGAQNCYFVTLEQCKMAVSGVGGFCTPNQFYDGRPVMTPGEAPRKKAG
jgi:uncharacterized protein DUF3551